MAFKSRLRLFAVALLCICALGNPVVATSKNITTVVQTAKNSTKLQHQNSTAKSRTQNDATTSDAAAANLDTGGVSLSAPLTLPTVPFAAALPPIPVVTLGAATTSPGGHTIIQTLPGGGGISTASVSRGNQIQSAGQLAGLLGGGYNTLNVAGNSNSLALLAALGGGGSLINPSLLLGGGQNAFGGGLLQQQLLQQQLQQQQQQLFLANLARNPVAVPSATRVPVVVSPPALAADPVDTSGSSSDAAAGSSSAGGAEQPAAVSTPAVIAQPAAATVSDPFGGDSASASASAATAVGGGGGGGIIPQYNPYASLFNYWRPQIPFGGGGIRHGGGVYINSCVGCSSYGDAIDTKNLTDETACVGFIEQQLEEPLRPEALHKKLDELKKKNPTDLTAPILQCCHKMFAVKLFSEKEAKTLLFDEPEGLDTGKTCKDMVHSFLKLMTGDVPKTKANDNDKKVVVINDNVNNSTKV